jgi:hypothetical protein
MRVKIGPYKNWIGPLQITEKIPFVSEDTRYKIADWLSETWVTRFLTWIYEKRKRKIDIRIDPYDTWSMDNTLAHIILPMLKQLRDTKHGSPIVDDEDLPPHMRYSDPKVDENGWDMGDNWVHYKWEWVLNEMIWAFEQELNENWEDHFRHGTPNFVEIPVPCVEDGFKIYRHVDASKDCFTLEQTNPDYWVDYEGMKRYNERIQNGFRLFGKYYQNLWD